MTKKKESPPLPVEKPKDPVHICPNCGYCPTCGQAKRVEYVPYPVYPWYPTWPDYTYPKITWTVTGTGTTNNTGGLTY